MDRRRLLILGASLGATALVSWVILPLAIPPFHMPAISDFLEVLLWQGMAAVGWPLALLGAALSILSGGQAPDPGALLPLLVYPAILALAIHVLTARTIRPWVLAVLHCLVVLSFAAVWWGVLQGYAFMAG